MKITKRQYIKTQKTKNKEKEAIVDSIYPFYKDATQDNKSTINKMVAEKIVEENLIEE